VPELRPTILYNTVHGASIRRVQALMNGHVKQIHELIADRVELIGQMPHAAVRGRSDHDLAQGLVGDQFAALVAVGELVDGLEEPGRKVGDRGDDVGEVG